MSLYEIKELVRTMAEIYCVCFAAAFGITCAVLLVGWLFGVHVQVVR